MTTYEPPPPTPPYGPDRQRNLPRWTRRQGPARARAYSKALRRLRDQHQDEFAALLTEERQREGLDE